MNNIFSEIPNNIEHGLFEGLIDNNKIKIERIISRGHTSPETGWYDQDKSEWVIVLQGEAIIIFSDESEVNLQTGAYINVEA